MNKQHAVKDTLTEAQIGRVIANLKINADASSQLIYVYPFIDTAAYGKNRSARNGAKVGAKLLRKYRAYNDAKSTQKEPFDKLKKWAIRVEGAADPVDRNFKSKESAINYANKLIAKGIGLKVEVAK